MHGTCTVQSPLSSTRHGSDRTPARLAMLAGCLLPPRKDECQHGAVACHLPNVKTTYIASVIQKLVVIPCVSGVGCGDKCVSCQDGLEGNMRIYVNELIYAWDGVEGDPNQCQRGGVKSFVETQSCW